MRTEQFTDVGLVRKRNEDYLYVGEDLFLVADGLGGHAAGDVASKLAVDTIVMAYTANIQYGMSKAQALFRAYHEANRVVIDAATQPEYFGMATTMVGMVLDGPNAIIVHVGDSRAYHLRHGEESRVLYKDTVDHHVCERNKATGEVINQYLTQAIGFGVVTPNIHVVKTVPGDVFLLCTDGLWNMIVRDDEDGGSRKLADLLAADPAGPGLLEVALLAGGRDNITGVIVRV